VRAIGRIEVLTKELDQSTFTADNHQVDGVLFNLMIIGEAVKNIPDEVRVQYPAIRWRDIGRFRDRVVHHYFALDMVIIWEIVSVHLPLLKTAAESLLQQTIDGNDEDSQPS
jgi:uncharacterized protein with HEPN domain